MYEKMHRGKKRQVHCWCGLGMSEEYLSPWSGGIDEGRVVSVAAYLFRVNGTPGLPAASSRRIPY